MARYPLRRTASLRRVGAALLALAAIAALAGADPAAARSPRALTAADTPDATTSVVLVLRPHDPAGLAALAAHPLDGTAARVAALRRAAPTRVTGDVVARWLTSHGFTVTGRSPWTVSASADPATAAHAFGVAAVVAGEHTGHRGRLRVPPALADAVTGVVGLDDTPWFRHATLSAPPAGTIGRRELDGAYDADPATAGAGATVATIQFSGWNAGDLRSYATATGIDAAPGALSPYTDTSQRPATYTAGDGDGDFEVALDQESLLATAPDAAQRMYFARNSLAGFELALASVLTDVQDGVPITALSISWGACELDLVDADDSDQLPTIESTLEQLAAAGVTVFAAAGDGGAYDCPQTLDDGSNNPDAGRRSVDFPGSSPVVVSVGGTRLTRSSGQWHEAAWGPTWPSRGRHLGGGGGFSALFARPRWQLGIGTPYAGHGRAVPDIASAADPSLGFAVYEKRLCGTGRWCVAGGTSAGAPAQTGLFVAALASQGRTAGIGDIHAALYGNPGAFRDIVAASNGTWTAGAGWDPATGLGAPRWRELASGLLAPSLVTPVAVRAPSVPVDASVPVGAAVTAWTAAEGTASSCSPSGSADPPTSIPLAAGADRVTHVAFGALTGGGACLRAEARVVLDRTPPTAYSRLGLYNGRDARVTLSWGTAADGSVSSGAAWFRLRLRRASDRAIVWSGSRARAGSQTFELPEGHAYRLEVSETDRAGNPGPWVAGGYLPVPRDGWHFDYGRGWRRASSRSAYGGGLSESDVAGARVTTRFTGSTLWLVAYTTPRSGIVSVSVDGHFIGHLDLYSRTYRSRHRLLAWRGRSGTHTVRFTVTGRRIRASGGTKAWIDAIAVR